MNTYIATSPQTTTPVRPRMAGLYGLKPWFTARLTPVIDAAVARQVSPDLFTAAGVVAAGCAGVAIAFGCWPLAAVFMVLRLAGANLDGAVARARGVSRPWGFVVNEIGDRTSDLLAFAGLAVWAAQLHGPGFNWLSWPVLQVVLAALAANLPTFASLAAAAAGATRRNGGPLGKTERCLFIVLAVAIPFIAPILLMQLVNGSIITTVLRLRAGHKELKAKHAEAQHAAETIAVERIVLPAPRIAVMPGFQPYPRPIDPVTQPLHALTRPMRTASAGRPVIRQGVAA